MIITQDTQISVKFNSLNNIHLHPCCITCSHYSYAYAVCMALCVSYFDNGRAVSATQKTNTSTMAGALTDERELDG